MPIHRRQRIVNVKQKWNLSFVNKFEEEFKPEFLNIHFKKRSSYFRLNLFSSIERIREIRWVLPKSLWLRNA